MWTTKITSAATHQQQPPAAIGEAAEEDNEFTCEFTRIVVDSKVVGSKGGEGIGLEVTGALKSKPPKTVLVRLWRLDFHILCNLSRYPEAN